MKFALQRVLWLGHRLPGGYPNSKTQSRPIPFCIGNLNIYFHHCQCDLPHISFLARHNSHEIFISRTMNRPEVKNAEEDEANIKTYNPCIIYKRTLK